jgi:ADP-ribose pyrophosphatase YjhB (NUDIX family)
MNDNNWLPEKDWALIQSSLPILCVDLLPYRRISTECEIGLILRATPHQGERWCLIGGRVRHGEPLTEALDRECNAAIGTYTDRRSLSGPKIVEYLPSNPEHLPHDPRKHAVSATYAAELEGKPVATGREALKFAWFRQDDLPRVSIGFGQGDVLNCLISSLPK